MPSCRCRPAASCCSRPGCEHSVPANASGQERVSIAFNLMYTDFTRRYSRPKWEGIKTDDSQEI